MTASAACKRNARSGGAEGAGKYRGSCLFIGGDTDEKTKSGYFEWLQPIARKSCINGQEHGRDLADLRHGLGLGSS
jgi:hypothetical protein